MKKQTVFFFSLLMATTAMSLVSFAQVSPVTNQVATNPVAANPAGGEMPQDITAAPPAPPVVTPPVATPISPTPSVMPPATGLTPPTASGVEAKPTEIKPTEIKTEATKTPDLVPVKSNISAAEKALLDNKDILKTLDQKNPSLKEKPKTEMPSQITEQPVAPLEEKNVAVMPEPQPPQKVTDILEEAANIRPLPEKYLVVKKDRSADDMDSRLVAARSALAEGRNQVALELFNGLYAESSTDKRVLVGRAVAMHKLGQVDAALTAYEVALSQDPQNIEALTNMLGIIKDQNHEMAIEKLLQLRQVYPANAEVAAQLGVVYGGIEKNEEAAKYLDMADTLKPQSPMIMFNRAVIYDRMGKTEVAARIYRQLLQFNDDDPMMQTLPLDIVRRRLSVLR